MWKYISKPRQTKQQFKSWEGMVNLMNTCLVVNTLLLSIDIVTMGFVKNKQDVSQWGKHFVSYYWNTLPLSICAHGTVSIYATALLCILSFIDSISLICLEMTVCLYLCHQGGHRRLVHVLDLDDDGDDE